MRKVISLATTMLLASAAINIAFFAPVYAYETPNSTASIETLIERANAENMQGNTAESERLLYAALKTTPYGSSYLLQIADGFNNLDEPEKAVPVYQEYLKQHPDDIDARLAFAKTLQHAHRYSEAENCYKEILQKDPGNKSALWQRAVLYDYTNRSRLASRELAALAMDDPNDPDLMSDYAHAQYWAGYDESALFAANVSHSAEIGLLTRDIKRDLGNSITGGTAYLADTDGLRFTEVYTWGEYYFDPTLVLTPMITYGHYRQNGDTVDAEEATVELAKRFGGINSSYGFIWPSVLLGVRDYGGWVTPAWRVAAQWLPDDLWHFQVYAENEVVDASVESIENHILFSYVAFEGRRDFADPRYSMAFDGGIGYFTGNNYRPEVGTDIDAIVVFDPEITLGLWAYYFHDSNTQDDLGYYNPDNYIEVGAGLEFNKEIDSYTVDLFVGLGRYNEIPGTAGPLGIGQIMLEKDFEQYGVLDLSFQYSNSAATGGQGGADYAQYITDINYTFYF